MRILSICYEYPPIGGGGAAFCQSINEAFVQAGHEVDLVTSGMPDLPSREEIQGVDIHRVRCWRRHRHYATTVELATQVRSSYRKAVELQEQRNYDIAHCHFIVPSGVTAGLLRRKTGLPFVITAHGSDVPGYNPDRFHLAHTAIQPIWRRVVQSADGLTTPSHFLARLIQRKLDLAVEVIPYCYDPTTQPAGDAGNRILVVTRMFERKGVQFLFHALKDLKTDWEILVAGDGPYLPKLRKLATEINLPVRFLGMVPRDELAALYHSSKIFVFPSIQENFPVVLLEAMAGGCAVITTSAMGCAEVVGDAAIKVEPGSVDGLRRAVRTLLDDVSERERLSAAGQRRVAKFSTENIVALYENIFAGVIASDQPLPSGGVVVGSELD
jgi:glycosyltransferase involved in cell wall biosynthesis